MKVTGQHAHVIINTSLGHQDIDDAQLAQTTSELITTRLAKKIQQSSKSKGGLDRRFRAAVAESNTLRMQLAQKEHELAQANARHDEAERERRHKDEVHAADQQELAAKDIQIDELRRQRAEDALLIENQRAELERHEALFAAAGALEQAGARLRPQR